MENNKFTISPDGKELVQVNDKTNAKMGERHTNYEAMLLRYPVSGWQPEAGKTYKEGVDFRVFDSDKWDWCVCEKCGWSDSGEYALGGGQIADTGDHSDVCCPKCGSIYLEGENPECIPESYSGIVAVPIPAPPAAPDKGEGDGIPRCTLTNDELISKVQEWVTKLCETGGRAWTLRVPVDVNTDPDCLITELCNRIKSLQPPAPSYPEGFVEWVGKEWFYDKEENLWWKQRLCNGSFIKFEKVFATTAQLFAVYQEYIKSQSK